MDVDQSYLTYEWRYTGTGSGSLKDAAAACRYKVENDTSGSISKQQAVARIEACLNSEGWHREVIEIILQD